MERLTKKNKHNQWVTPFCTRYDDEVFNEYYTGASVTKLAEYEDNMVDIEKLKRYLDENIEMLESKDIVPGSFQDGSLTAFSVVRLLIKRAED